MLGNFRTTGVRTNKGTISSITSAGSLTTTRNDLTKTQRRANARTMFAGGVVYSDVGSTQILTAILSVKDGTTTSIVDRATIGIGRSIVWLEQDFGIVLENDEYVEVTLEESLSSGDKVYIYLHSKEII
jgi:hypothetical protein